MKKLTSIRLINWYHIIDETLPIEGSTLFMGDNGSGKSTILDAIQLALVVDLSQVRFNQAANENAERNLQGYTRWMVNSEGSKESNVYKRASCTSYVVLEFYDESDKSPFLVGVSIDSYSDGRDPNRLHFFANSQQLKDVSFFNQQEHLLSSAEFARAMKAKSGFIYSREPGIFREQLLLRLGKLSPDFTKILVKAQAFKPLGKVQQFVMDFLLDPRPLETQSLQDNLSNYKLLEQKSIDANRRIEALEGIHQVVDEYERAQSELRQHRYLELRGQLGIIEEKLEQISENKAKCSQNLDEIMLAERSHLSLQEKLESELGSMIRMLNENSKFAERERVRDDVKRFQVNLDQKLMALKKIESSENKIQELILKLRSYNEPLFNSKKVNWKDARIQYQLNIQKIKEQLLKIKEEGEFYQAQLKNLKKGIRPYPEASTVLKELIETETHAKVSMLCELIEVEDPEWQDAAEAYLNTRRFDLILDPKFFQEALSLYEKHKKILKIQSVGLVDCERVKFARAKSQPGSLAEIITTRNQHARSYVDFLMGDLIRCDSEWELRKFSRSMTRTCMVYQNHAARQSPFEVYSTWFIGNRGHHQLIMQTEQKIKDLAEQFKLNATQQESFENILKLLLELEGHLEVVTAKDELESEIDALKEDLNRYLKLLKELSSSELFDVESKMEETRIRVRENQERIQKILIERGSLESKIEYFLDQNIQNENVKNQCIGILELEFQDYLNSKDSSGEVHFEKLYQEQLQKQRTPEEIAKIFEIQRKGKETQKANLIAKLTGLRVEFNSIFRFAGKSEGEDCTDYLKELKIWKESFLPEFKEKIVAAKEKALQQLMEDVVHKLRENLDLVPEQFENINRSLRGFQFGQDQYQFSYKVKREFENFERLIREAGEYENQPLFETEWRSRFKSGGGLEELFNNLIGGSSHLVQNELKQYSDYREYYDYDLKIYHSDGTVSNFSQVNKWKSGGETQTPYYIAVLASLYRLYRLIGEGKNSVQTIGLVILDEAFNKMDEDRLKATLEFTRQLGLQLIMAVPKERAEFIIPHVESIWLVAKHFESGQAIIEDFHQVLNEDGEQNKMSLLNEVTLQ